MKINNPVEKYFIHKWKKAEKEARAKGQIYHNTFEGIKYYMGCDSYDENEISVSLYAGVFPVLKLDCSKQPIILNLQGV